MYFLIKTWVHTETLQKKTPRRSKPSWFMHPPPSLSAAWLNVFQRAAGVKGWRASPEVIPWSWTHSARHSPATPADRWDLALLLIQFLLTFPPGTFVLLITRKHTFQTLYKLRRKNGDRKKNAGLVTNLDEWLFDGSLRLERWMLPNLCDTCVTV